MAEQRKAAPRQAKAQAGREAPRMRVGTPLAPSPARRRGLTRMRAFMAGNHARLPYLNGAVRGARGACATGGTLGACAPFPWQLGLFSAEPPAWRCGGGRARPLEEWDRGGRSSSSSTTSTSSSSSTWVGARGERCAPAAVASVPGWGGLQRAAAPSAVPGLWGLCQPLPARQAPRVPWVLGCLRGDDNEVSFKGSANARFLNKNVVRRVKKCLILKSEGSRYRTTDFV